jgi:trk system potassium uptake protein TrkA
MARRGGARDYAVTGLNRFGAALARRLEENDLRVLAIDRSIQRVQEIADEVTQAVALDPTDEDALAEVGISDFHTVIVAMGQNFESTVLTAATLVGLGVERVICEAETETQRDVLLKIGAARVIQPDQSAAVHLADELSATSVVDFLDLDQEHRIAVVTLSTAHAGKTLGDSGLEDAHGIRVVAIKHDGGWIAGPGPETALAAGDHLLALGDAEAIRKYRGAG